jgi:hypothetical protein
LNITDEAITTSVRSLYQSDLIGMRTVLEISWGLRAAGGLAWLENVIW